MQTFAEKEAEAFLEKNKFQVIPRMYVKTLVQAQKAAKKLGYPLVIKVSSTKILHKSDVGGVKIDIRTEKELAQAVAEIQKIKGCEGILVQKFIPGYQILIGLKKDQVFGHVLAVGTGGIYTEILKDVNFHIGALQMRDAQSLLEQLKSYPILQGARGTEKANLDALKNLMVKLSHLPEKYENIEELDMNPIIVNAKGAYIADARIIFS